MNLILRLYDPDEGKVTIDGVDIRRVTRELAALQHGRRVPGEHAVQHVDPREHPARQGGRDRRGGRGRRPQGRDPPLHPQLPHGYDTAVGERGDTLSGGQRQRIAIARAIVRDPAVLLLDEATSALDQTTEAAINRTLLKLAKGRTMIFSTHRLTSVVEMDEIIVISGRQGDRARLPPGTAAPRAAPTGSSGTTRATNPIMTTKRMRTTDEDEDEDDAA